MNNEKRQSLYDLIHAAQDGQKGYVLKNYLAERTVDARWPQNALLELSPVCNLACKMCYIRKTQKQADEMGGLLSVGQWKQIVDRCAEIGVMNYTLTGGECLLYPGFAELYNYIYEKSSFITLMTNLALLSPEHIELLRKKKPYEIVITVYGSSRETYGRLCSNADAYDKVMNALRALKENGIPFRIQMTVVRENVDDMADVIRLARELNVEFNYSDTLTAFGNTDEPLRQAEQTEREKVVGILKREFQRRPEKKKISLTEEQILEQRKAMGKPPRPGIRCNAARNTLCITWRGEMKACVVLDAYKVSVLKHDFRETWENMVRWADSLCVLPECYTCEHATKCVACIAQHYNDTHDFSKPSPRLCWKIKHPDGAPADEADEEIPECPDGF